MSSKISVTYQAICDGFAIGQFNDITAAIDYAETYSGYSATVQKYFFENGKVLKRVDYRLAADRLKGVKL